MSHQRQSATRKWKWPLLALLVLSTTLCGAALLTQEIALEVAALLLYGVALIVAAPAG